MQILKDNGLIPGVDVKLTHTSIEIGWEALKRGDVAAFGTNHALAYSDRILGLTQGRIELDDLSQSLNKRTIQRIYG
ncbi:MAG: hypothetical protein ACREX9_20305 [Gammaproteobacteria bacterium]